MPKQDKILSKEEIAEKLNSLTHWNRYLNNPDGKSQTKEQPLEKLTEGNLEEVEKLKKKKDEIFISDLNPQGEIHFKQIPKKAKTYTKDQQESMKSDNKNTWEIWLEERKTANWQNLLNKKWDSSMTPDKILEAFNVYTGKRNNDATGSKEMNTDSKSRAVVSFLDTLRDRVNMQGSGGANDIKSKKTKRDILEKLTGQSNDFKKAMNVIKLSMGDPTKANQHEQNTTGDVDGDVIVDTQIYIGKPSQQGKEEDNEHIDN